MTTTLPCSSARTHPVPPPQAPGRSFLLSEHPPPQHPGGRHSFLPEWLHPARRRLPAHHPHPPPLECGGRIYRVSAVLQRVSPRLLLPCALPCLRGRHLPPWQPAA